jgi:hypothetical protein
MNRESSLASKKGNVAAAQQTSTSLLSFLVVHPPIATGAAGVKSPEMKKLLKEYKVLGMGRQPAACCKLRNLFTQISNTKQC